ncbi:phosphate regulon transcriptional regulatory protein PhoB [Parasedimentitalea marina]|uniref:Phosphate regulon transcriptional regulatory protein PhoB n=1 Tax=Parasedimentitalea marina TaxID=2483033 RepID=A0A3T0N8D3_9RHOB|nr:phosphate regulon transcriptional regulatory protein PhoB [Parasedimentitalea marina]
MSDPKILVIEDEPSQVEVLRFNLSRQGFTVEVAMDGEDGLHAAREDPPDLILLDWMLPSLSGVEVCRLLRRNKITREIPIIMLTAKSEERDKVRGLDVGADDYVTKPYSVKELIARVRAALRRPAARVFDKKLSAGPIEIDLEKHIVTCHAKPVTITGIEFRLLTTLIQSPERVFSREQLLDMVWGISANVETRTVDVHVGRLRRTLKKAGEPELVRTVRGFGYSYHP